MPERYDGPIIDAHHHVWDLSLRKHPWLEPGVQVPHRYGDYETIKHDYFPVDYLADVAGTGVVASVYMEAEWDPADPLAETALIESWSARTGVPGAMTAQATLDAPEVADVLAAQAAHSLVRSVRHKPGGPTSPAEVAAGGQSLMSDPTWRAGYALLAEHGLHFELQTPWWNLAEARTLAQEFPETLLIVNHSGVLADREPGTMAAWREAMVEIAALPNVAVKASGLCVQGTPWTVELNHEPVLEMVRIFGADRVMFGSNFPVDAMFITYPRLVAGYRAILADLDAASQRAVFHDTAARIYRPSPFRPSPLHP